MDMSLAPISMSIKIVLMGDGGVGKSALIGHWINHTFEKKYVATFGVSVTPLTISTNYGDFHLDIWDTAGQEKFGGLFDGYLIGAQAVLLMLDVGRRITYKNLPYWQSKITSPEVITLIVGTKVDLHTHKVSEDQYDIGVSIKTGHNVTSPLQHLLQQVTGHPDLVVLD